MQAAANAARVVAMEKHAQQEREKMELEKAKKKMEV